MAIVDVIFITIAMIAYTIGFIIFGIIISVPILFTFRLITGQALPQLIIKFIKRL